MLMRFDPFRGLDRANDLFSGFPKEYMPLDAYRSDDKVVVKVDLPGVDLETIDVTVDRNVLTVQASREAEVHQGKQLFAAERPHGSFTRRLMVSEAIDTGHIGAAYENGVLTVTLPVAETAKPRRVEVSVGGSAKAVDAKVSNKKAVDSETAAA